jgi:hydrogenase maturation protease
MNRRRTNLVLALGNDILGDDGVAFAVARELRPKWSRIANIEESSEAGLALLELIEGYERVLLLDAVITGKSSVGTIMEFWPENFRKILAPSPHYAGLPEVLDLAGRLGVEFPREIVVLGMEVEDPYEIREGLSPTVEEALPEFVRRAESVLEQWEREDAGVMSSP